MDGNRNNYRDVCIQRLAYIRKFPSSVYWKGVEAKTSQ